MAHQFHWWQTGIIYQVYVRSFQDSDNDGIGDLRGILRRIDYLKSLGISAVWITPVYPSPMADFGYDISDYTDIHPLFGNMNDFDELLEALHDVGLKLILDLVPNHTSSEHPWFREARSSRDNPKRNWYIWHDGVNGKPPNNWLSVFGGSAWEWDEQTQQFYYHAFLKEQPDLNWRNHEVQQAMTEVMRFWLDKGVDGFRVDVMWHMVKDELLRDNPPNPDYKENMLTYDQLLPVFSTDQHEVHAIVRNMRSVLDEYKERVMIGEIYLPVHKLMTYYGDDKKGAHLPFNFILLNIPWDSLRIAAAINEYEGLLPDEGWPNWVLGNHDQPRIMSRTGYMQSKIAAMLLLTLRGTPTIYYGDEIGMADVSIPFSQIKDPQGLNMPEKHLSRDPARTPMQWDDSENAGFSKNESWLPVHKAFKRINVKAQQSDPYSMLNFYKRLINLRQSEPSLMYGKYYPYFSDHQLIAYRRMTEGHPSFVIILNLTHRPAWINLKSGISGSEIIFSSTPELEGMRVHDSIAINGDEGMIIQCGTDSFASEEL